MNRLAVGIIIQARVDSSRFPEKVLKKILGKPLAWHVIERCKRFRGCDNVVLATSSRRMDDELAAIGRDCKVDIYRGSATDVLDRYYRCASKFKFDTVIRITADCPLIDADIGGMVLKEYLESGLDYVRTGYSFPDGLSVEVFSFNTLKKAWKNAKLPSEREHVTPYMIMNPGLVASKIIEHSPDLSNYRFTVDYKEDLAFVNRIYESLYLKNKNFSLKEILQLLKNNPEIQRLMPAPKRNEGYNKSLEYDRKYLKLKSRKKRMT